MALCAALTALACIVGLTAGEQTVPAGDTSLVATLGRVTVLGDSTLDLSWLGGGVRVVHTGTTLRATFAAVSSPFHVGFYQSNEGYMPFEGIAWVPGSGLNETVVVGAGAGTVDLILNEPPQYFKTATLLSLTTDGEFTAPTAPTRILHALGDSITAATNVRGGFPHCADSGMQADYSSSWMGILCNFFDASCSTVAVGGHGLVRNCCGQSDGLMPDFYRRYSYANPAPFPFKDPVPQGVLVYLGTNDYNKGESPSLDASFTASMLMFMSNVTKLWYGTPQAPAKVTFFAVLGPMSPTLPANATVDALNQAAGLGYNVHLINATTACGPDLTGCTDGCAGHPGVASHRNIARIAAPIVASALGWPVPGVL